ncbi:hypothetical protein Bca4012_050114 [Brassica carinata]
MRIGYFILHKREKNFLFSFLNGGFLFWEKFVYDVAKSPTEMMFNLFLSSSMFSSKSVHRAGS